MDLLRSVLPPELVARIDWTTLEPRDGTFVDDTLTARHTDLLFTANFDDRPLHIYFLFEHKSSPPPRHLALDLLRYEVRIWDRDRQLHPDARELPPILPIVFYHGTGTWNVATEFSQLVAIPADVESLRAFIPKFRYILTDLSTADIDAMQDHGVSPITRLAVVALAEARTAPTPQQFLTSHRPLLREVCRHPDGVRALRLFFSYLWAVRRPEELSTINLRALDIGSESEAIMETMAGALIQQGLEQGLKQGLKQGYQQGLEAAAKREDSASSLFIRLLTRKFPQVPDSLITAARTVPPPTLARWAEQLLTATTLDEVFAEPGAPAP